ncbi:MAG: DUF1295 domain-containing protein [Nocardioides sp.]
MIDSAPGMLVLGLGTVTIVMVVTTLVSRLVGRVSVVDVAWGLGFVAVVVVAALLGDGDVARRWLLAVLVAVWGLRLAQHIYRRSRGHGEDPRYAALLGDSGFATVVRKVFLTQGVAMWFISLPVLVAAVTEVHWWALVGAGAALWLVGLVVEAVGDAQLAAYRSDPDRAARGPVMDRGLWAWTRHPNYFGDACVWWGIWLIGGPATGWLPGLLTVAAPLAMTYFLVYATGARLLEKTMMKREGYPEYAARTSMFFPLPPRRH